MKTPVSFGEALVISENTDQPFDCTSVDSTVLGVSVGDQ